MFRVINANGQATVFRSRTRNRGRTSATSALSYFNRAHDPIVEMILVKVE